MLGFMTIPPLAAQDLVQLKALLEQAVAAARSGAPLQRLTAVVLLDAVNERAMHVAARPLGVTLAERDTFEAVANKIGAPLERRWARQGWQDVRILHRVRNLAQHEGITADRELLPAWTTATGLFTRTLVTLSHGVDLDEVTLADAVADSEIAGFLRRADAALAQGEPQAAVAAAADAFDRARRRWLSARPGSGAFGPLRPAAICADDEFRDINAELRSLAEASAVAAFAPDLAEYLWFREIAAERFTPPTPAEAQRAVAFSFWWIVRWEAFTGTYVPDRRTAHLRAVREIRTGPGPVRIDDVQLRPDTPPGSDTATFILAGLPGEDRFREWAGAVGARLRETIGVHCYIGDDGALVVPIRHDADPDTTADAVRDALTAADVDVDVARQEAAEQQAGARAADQAWREAARGQPLPAWVTAAGLATDDATSPRGPCVHLQLDETFAPGRVHETIRAHPDITQCYSGREATVITPPLPPDRLARVLWEVDNALRPEVEQRAAAAHARAAALRTRAAELRSALERTADGPPP